MSFLFLIYLFAIVALSIYGLHVGVLLVIARRVRASAPTAPLPEPAVWPFVTIHLPLFNERYVVNRVIQAALAIDYPRDRFEIHVLDDSTDDTQAIASRAIEAAAATGVSCRLLHRSHRLGYKAGALAEAMPHARGEFIAIFDADFVPPRDFLRRLVPEFLRPGAERLGFVQTRWTYLNREENLMTRVQATMYDLHFFVEQPARCGAGLPFNFNGSGGIWRRTCVDDGGGWQRDTLTEDLDLSYRVETRGWRGLYRGEIPAPNELPETLLAYKRQQARWARGSMQTARKLAGVILRSPLGGWQKASALIHLTAFGLHLMLLVFLVLWPVFMLEPFYVPGALLRLHWSLNLLSPLCLTFIAGMWYAHHQQRRPIAGLWRDIAVALVLGVGMCFSNSIALLQGLLLPQSGEFERTPKSPAIRRATLYRLPLRWSVLGELALAIIMGLACQRLLYFKQYLGALGAGFYAFCFCAIVILQVREMLVSAGAPEVGGLPEPEPVRNP